MRDNSSVDSESPASKSPSSISETETFYDMKRRLLADRTEQNAVGIFEQLLLYRADDVSWDLLPELKDLIVCIFDTIGIVSITEKHQILVLNGINNSPAKVVDIIADYYAHRIDDVYEMLAGSHVAVTIAFARRIGDFDCAESVAVLLKRFASLKLIRDELLNRLKSKSAEIRFRAHQVTALVMKEDNSLNAVTELINQLAIELESDDILSQLNAVEMFADAASQKTSTAEYLLSAGIVDRLYALFIQSMDHPDAGFLYPAFLKFFGHLSVADIECIPRFPKFLDSLFDLVYHFDRLDASMRLTAFDTLSAVGSTDRAKKFLSEKSAHYDMERAMNSFGAAMASGPVDLRVRHIDALAMLLRAKDGVKDDEIEAIGQKWFNWLGEPFPSVIVSYLSKPFVDIRLSSLRLLLALFDHAWAIRVFYRTAGFLECILNRSTETNAEGRQYKFDIVCKLIDSGDLIIPAQDMIRLKLYRREGAFYVERNPQIDMEND